MDVTLIEKLLDKQIIFSRSKKMKDIFFQLIAKKRHYKLNLFQLQPGKLSVSHFLKNAVC